MKGLKYISIIFILCLLLGYGTKHNININNENKQHDTISPIETNTAAAMETAIIPLEPVTYNPKQIMADNNYSVLADSKDGKITLFDAVTEKEIQSFDELYGSGSLYLSMTDENNGVLLYCSSPACGQMIKQLYSTKDRWQTFHKTDISSQIDGYPTSLSAQSDKHMYIGAQMRSDGYLFETVDGGKNWIPVIIESEITKCRYGYAPIRDDEKNMFYVLLECDGFYSLYQSDTAMSEWKRFGTFSPETEIASYFIWENEVIVTDMQGECYRLQGNL